MLGFEICIQRPTATFLTCGMIHHDLALFQAPEGALAVAEGQIGLNHFAVQVEDLGALKETYQSLKDHGAKLDHNTDHGITSSVYFFDPDGIRIEFYCDNCASLTSVSLLACGLTRQAPTDPCGCTALHQPRNVGYIHYREDAGFRVRFDSIQDSASVQGISTGRGRFIARRRCGCPVMDGKVIAGGQRAC